MLEVKRGDKIEFVRKGKKEETLRGVVLKKQMGIFTVMAKDGECQVMPKDIKSNLGNVFDV